MSEKNFTVIEDWMYNLGLSSNELLIFATIYSFNQNDDAAFSGRFEYFVKRLHIARRTVIRTIQNLIHKNLIVKDKGILNGQYSCCNSYRVNNDFISSYRCQNVTPECQNVTPEVPNCHTTQCQNVTPEVPNCHTSQCQTVTPEVPNCHTSQCQNVTPKYNQPNTNNYYNQPNTNNEYNTLSPNGDCESDNCESDIVERELGINDANNEIEANNEDNAINDNAGKAKKTKAKSKRKENAEIATEQNFGEQPPSRERACQKNNKNRTQERFEKFWAAYPRHIDKAKALKAFTKINPSDELLEQMLNNITEAKKTTQWQTQQYIPYPTTWLNGSRWEDEIDPKDIEYDITSDERFDNPTDRAVLNGENPFADEDWWG